MAEAQVYNQEGKKLDKIKLDPKVFDVAMKESLVHEAVVAGMAQSRKPYAHVKERGEVRGGGRKPWRQKGTGRARAGSIRSPIWIGGGVTFGPRKERVFEVKINKQAKRKALLMALSAMAKEGDILVLDEIKMDEPKTNVLAKIFKNLPGIERRALVVLDKPNRVVMQAVKNIEWLKVIGANNLNIVDLVDYPKVVILKNALPEIEKLYSLK